MTFIIDQLSLISHALALLIQHPKLYSAATIQKHSLSFCEMHILKFLFYPKFLDRMAWASSVELLETAPGQSLHCLPLIQEVLDISKCRNMDLMDLFKLDK